MFFFFKWLLLSRLIGSPLGALALLLVGGWVVDRMTFGVLPRPFRWLGRFRRQLDLRATLRNNPNDRRARFELADQIQRYRPREALELLRPNLEAGDTDPGTLLVMGTACFKAGHAKEAELFLREAAKQAPGFRSGAIWLELGRGLSGALDPRGAVEALRTFLVERPGSVEGKVLLAKALEGSGDSEGARAELAKAWSDYRAAPAFKRREERLWAYRAQPWRVLPWLGLLALLAAAIWAWRSS
jgi:predicted Zn-dependent protease